ncbi:MAG: hypothetical protein ACM3JQ_04670 [Candidatus Eiseniibacteriota bacterium]
MSYRTHIWKVFYAPNKILLYDPTARQMNFRPYQKIYVLNVARRSRIIPSSLAIFFIALTTVSNLSEVISSGDKVRLKTFFVY